MTRAQLALRVALGLGLCSLLWLLEPHLAERWDVLLGAVGGSALGSLVVEATQQYRTERKQQRALEEEAEVYDKHRRGL